MSNDPRLPRVDRAKILGAMYTFDMTMRQTYQWSNNTYAVLGPGSLLEAQLYPPKVIISLATGKSVREFSGGAESHRYLARLGFTSVAVRTMTVVAGPQPPQSRAA